LAGSGTVGIHVKKVLRKKAFPSLRAEEDKALFSLF
jgi:hypothetical protein